MSTEELLKFGENMQDKNMQAYLLKETANACYVMSRPILNARALWYFPASFFVMHHSLESFIKAFLLKENIDFEYGQKGHDLVYLLSIGVEKNEKLSFFNEIIKDEQVKGLFTSLSNSYNSNKYWEVGFNVQTISTIDIFDKVMSIFTKHFHIFYGNKNKEASIDVPEEFADLIENNRKYPITLCILPKYEN